jgi:hypothetical protein
VAPVEACVTVISVKGMDAIENFIMDKAREFDSIGDWPQPFDAFKAPGATQDQVTAAIRRLAERNQLSTLAFEAEGMGRVDVVADLGQAIAHQTKPGPGEPGHHRSPTDPSITIRR